MSIRWDSLLVHHLAVELDRRLARARLRAIRLDGAERDLTLIFRELTLVWRLHPTRGYPLQRAPIEPVDGDLKHQCRLRRVTAPPDERSVRFELLPTRGGRGALDVIVELMGNQWNAIVTDPATGTVRHVLWTRRGKRAARAGHAYTPPPPGARLGIRGDLSAASWEDLFDDVPPAERARHLIARVAWTSPLNADTLLDASTSDLPRAYERWASLVPPGEPEPVILQTARGPQPYPLPLPGANAHRAASLLDAFELCASLTAPERPHQLVDVPLLPPALLRRLRDAVIQASRRVDRLKSELAGLEDPDELRRTGDLILARYPDIEAGSEEAVLADFDGNEIRVVLDPVETPHGNAARYYQRASKAARALMRIPGLLAEASATSRELDELLRRVEAGEAETREVLDALPAAPPRVSGGETQDRLPYRAFRSSGGLEIRVGRGARHNDDLTFHHSAPNDVWMHARHSAGAHVVLRWPGPGSPPARDLREAAALAALHSRARTSASVPVDWTLRKYVRKPRGSAPGRVVPERVKTLFVDPDASLKDTLAEA